MIKHSFVSVLIAVACFFGALTTVNTVEDHDIKERPVAVGRSYSLTTCDYKTQIGYTCLSCSRALHCYVGNVAILVDCYGIFRYCRDGRCSMHQGEKCSDNKATTPGPYNTTIQTDTTHVDSSEPTTRLLTDESSTEAMVTQNDEEVTTISDNLPSNDELGASSALTTTSTSTESTVDDTATTGNNVSTTVPDISSNVV